MTLSTFDSPNCVVRSLEQQLEATNLNEDDNTKAAHSKMDDGAAYKTPTKNEEEEEEESLQQPEKVTMQFPTSLQAVRNLIFQLCGITGSLSSLFWQKMPLDHNNSMLRASASSTSTTPVPDEVIVVMVQLLQQLMDLSTALSLDLGKVCSNKIELNNRKYPVDLCKGRAGKYTQYSKATGITKYDGQSTVDLRSTGASTRNPPVRSAADEWQCRFVNETVTDITLQTRQFAVQREWEQYHTPRNLLLALTGELGELAELFQWKGDTDDPLPLSLTEHDKVGQELADVTIYLCRLADVCGVSLSNEMKKK